MDLTFATILLVAVALLVFYLINNYTFWKKRGIPCVGGLIPLVGNIFPVISFKLSFSCFCRKLYNEYKDYSMVGFYKLTVPVLLIRDPELVNTVLQSNFKSFHDNTASIDSEVDPLLRNNPFFTSGDVWAIGRKRVTHAFTGKKLKVLFETVTEVCTKFENFLERKLQTNANEFELKNIFSKFTGEVVANTALGIEGYCFEDDSHPSSFDRIGKSFLTPSFKNGIVQSLVFFMPELRNIVNVKFIPKDVENFFRGAVKEVLKNRKNETTSRNDYFQLMLDFELASGLENFDEETLTGHCLSFFMDGFETSSATLSFVGYHLALHQTIQDKVRREVMSVMSKYNGRVTYESLKEMTYMDQVISESQRCYPTAGVLVKKCTSECELKGSDGLRCRVEPGMEIVVPIHGLHTDPKYWVDPETFDPERFNDQRKKNIEKLTYLPFGEGPRICVGMRMATLQMKACLAFLLNKYRLDVSPKTHFPVKLSPSYFLSAPVGGFWVYINKL